MEKSRRLTDGFSPGHRPSVPAPKTGLRGPQRRRPPDRRHGRRRYLPRSRATAAGQGSNPLWRGVFRVCARHLISIREPDAARLPVLVFAPLTGCPWPASAFPRRRARLRWRRLCGHALARLWLNRQRTEHGAVPSTKYCFSHRMATPNASRPTQFPENRRQSCLCYRSIGKQHRRSGRDWWRAECRCLCSGSEGP